jgi:hypothetical protein
MTVLKKTNMRAIRDSLLAASLAVSMFSCGPSAGGGDGGICSRGTTVATPNLCTDRDTLGFAREFNSGTFIGTTVKETLIVRNPGTTDLEISSITLSGDNAFSMTTSWDDNRTDRSAPAVKVRSSFKVQPDGGLFVPSPIPNDPPYRESATIEVSFAPTRAQLYTGQITINSNADNTPMKVIAIEGCGVPSDGGSSPCYQFIDCSRTNDAGVSICADGGR